VGAATKGASVAREKIHIFRFPLTQAAARSKIHDELNEWKNQSFIHERRKVKNFPREPSLPNKHSRL